MSGLSFEKKAVLKAGDEIIVNDGNDPSTSRVAHLKQKSDGRLVEMTYKEALRHRKKARIQEALERYGVEGRGGMNYTKLLRRLDSQEGLEQTPSWFEHLNKSVSWDYDSLLLEMSHSGGSNFFIRDFKGDKERGAEYLATLLKEADDMLSLEVIARLQYQTDSDVSVEEIDSGEVDGTIRADLEVQEVEDDEGRVHRYPDVEVDYNTTLEGSVASGAREVLTGVCLKHWYDDETLFFQSTLKDGIVFLDVFNKDFEVVFRRDGQGLMMAPLWAQTLLRADGAPVELQVNEDSVVVEELTR